MKVLILLAAVCHLSMAATGTLQGIVHDPQHRPIAWARSRHSTARVRLCNSTLVRCQWRIPKLDNVAGRCLSH